MHTIFVNIFTFFFVYCKKIYRVYLNKITINASAKIQFSFVYMELVHIKSGVAKTPRAACVIVIRSPLVPAQVSALLLDQVLQFGKVRKASRSSRHSILNLKVN